MLDLKLALSNGDKRALARAITLVENQHDQALELLQNLEFNQAPLIGITGPPGAGKSTLISALCGFWLNQGLKVGIVAVDPSSPFNQGAIMGDRLRMSEHFLHPNLFIRSMASRGNLGGLSPKIFEVCDLFRAAGFDKIIIETVGVGQSEVEIAGLADTTVLVLVPEAGDDIQAIKSGIMEIGEVYVVNKSDREGADVFYKNLVLLAHSHATHEWETPVVKTVAQKNIGIESLVQAVENHRKAPIKLEQKAQLLSARAMMMIAGLRTRDVNTKALKDSILVGLTQPGFNLYKLVASFA
jgi:LAO/AO transport system kinase